MWIFAAFLVIAAVIVLLPIVLAISVISALAPLLLIGAGIFAVMLLIGWVWDRREERQK